MLQRKPIPTGGETHLPHIELLAEFRRESAAIVKTLVERTRAHPRYAELDGRPAADVRRTIAWVFDTLTTCLSESRGLLPEELERFEAIGVARAAEGVPLEALVERFTEAFEYCYRQLRAISGTQRTAAFDDLALALHRLRDVAVEAIRRGYHGTAGSTTASRTSMSASFVEAVVHPGVSPRQLRDRARQADYASAEHLSLLVVTPATDDADTDVDSALNRLAAVLPHAARGTPRWHPLPHGLILLPYAWTSMRSHKEAIDQVCVEEAVTVTVIEAPPNEAERIGVIYRRMYPLLHVAAAITTQARQLSQSSLEAYGPHAETPRDKAEAILRETFGALLALPREKAIQRLGYLRGIQATGGNILKAARRTKISRATAYVWLNEIRSLTGLDVRDPLDFERINRALRLWDLHSATLPRPGDPWWRQG